MSRQAPSSGQWTRRAQSTLNESLSALRSGIHVIRSLTRNAFKEPKKGVKRKGAPISPTEDRKIAPDSIRRTRPRTDSPTGPQPEILSRRRQGGVYTVNLLSPPNAPVPAQTQTPFAPPPTPSHFPSDPGPGPYRRRPHRTSAQQVQILTEKQYIPPPSPRPLAAPRMVSKPLPPVLEPLVPPPSPSSVPRLRAERQRRGTSEPYPPPSPLQTASRKSIRGVSHTYQGINPGSLGSNSAGKNRVPSHEPADGVSPRLTKVSPQMSRLSIASDSTSASLNRYLQLRRMRRQSFERSAVQGVSILEYERAGSWVVNHPLTKDHAFLCPIACCEAHYTPPKELRRSRPRRTRERHRPTVETVAENDVRTVYV